MDKDSKDLKETATIAIASTEQIHYKLLESRFSELKDIYPIVAADKLLTNRAKLQQLMSLAICEKKELIDEMKDLRIQLHQVLSYRKPDIEFIQMIHDAIITTTDLIMQQLSYEKEMLFNKALEEQLKNQHIVKHAFLRRKREETKENEKEKKEDKDED